MSDPSDFDRVTPGGLAAAAAAAASGSAVDLVVPGVGSAVGVGVQALINFVGRGIERRQRKALDALDEACRVSRTAPEELLDHAGLDDGRMELTMGALTAAAQAGTAAKVRALGRALATGVLANDDAIVERETYIVDALSRLEPPHVRVLDVLNETRVPQVNGRLYHAVNLAWPVAAIAAKYPEAGPTLPSLLATLVSVGAVVDVAIGTTDYSPTYETNEFGELLLARLREAGAQ